MTVEETLCRLVSEHLGVPLDQVRLDSRLVVDLGGDSLSLVRLVDAVEAAFAVDLDDERLNALVRVRDMLDWIAADRKTLPG